MNWKKIASILHTQRLKLYLSEGMEQREASKRAYKDVGEELKLFFEKGFEPKDDNIDQMRDEFQKRKSVIEGMANDGMVSERKSAVEKKQVWEDIHRKFNTQKKKSVKFIINE